MTTVRYGVFLRPDPATCWNVTQHTIAIERQFGLVSAGAFPPHVTLAGNIATRESADLLAETLDAVFARTGRFPVYNAGVVRTTGFAYDVDLGSDRRTPNASLRTVAAGVKAAVLPLYTPVDDYLVPRLGDYVFAGHIGLASHELLLDDHLADEIGDFIAATSIPAPPDRFDARWYSLFRFESDWAGPWWETLTWRHLHSWEIR